MEKITFKNGVLILSVNKLNVSDLEGIVKQIPEEYGAYIDRRFKKELWIFQKECKVPGPFSLQDYMEDKLGILCTTGGISYEKKKIN